MEARKEYDKNYLQTENGRLVDKRKCTKYRATHKLRISICQKQYYENNKLKKLIKCKQYRQSEAGKLTDMRHSIKRRGLGFFPLNRFFDGCAAHHISKNFVIYIPEELHKSIYHDIWTWQNMDIINKLAIEFL